MSHSVLHLIASSRGGGAVHVRDLACGLVRGGHRVQVAMPDDGGSVSPSDFQSMGIPYQMVDIAAGLSLGALANIRRLAAQVDIVHVHGARAALFGRLVILSLGSRRPRLVYTIHGFAAPHYAPPKREILLLQERLLSGVTNAWICVSEAERDSLLAAGVADARRTHVIHNGIDPERFASLAETRQELRQNLGLPSHSLVITTVCRLYRPRDFPTLLEAFQQVLSRVPAALLLLAGDGPLRNEIELSVQSLGLRGHVCLLGLRRDVPQLLHASDVFVLSSRGWEGLPLTALEAMAASLPVVASDVGGTREAVVDQVTGFLYPAGDSAALAQRLLTLADNPDLAARMREQGRARVREFFTVERMVRETEVLYQQLSQGA